MDSGHLGTLTVNGERQRVSGFTFTLGYSRIMVAEAALDQKLCTLLRMHEEAFRQLGGVPEEPHFNRGSIGGPFCIDRYRCLHEAKVVQPGGPPSTFIYISREFKMPNSGSAAPEICLRIQTGRST